jgi:transposase
MVLDYEHSYPSQWAAIESIADKIVCTCETHRRRVRQHEHDKGRNDGSIPGDPDRIKELECAVPVHSLHGATGGCLY